MRFLPLAISDMAGEGICVAGLDIDAQKLIRLVLPGKRCLFTEQATQFMANAILEVRVGKRQPREESVDPEVRHAEDVAMVGAAPDPIPVKPREKLGLLTRRVDHDLHLSVARGGRSLLLVELREFSYRTDAYGKQRFGFMSSVPATSAGSSSTSIHGKRISVSQEGPACTCPSWIAFADRRWPGQAVTRQEVASACPDSKLFLLLSLSALYSGRYWLIAAGVHIVGESTIWL